MTRYFVAFSLRFSQACLMASDLAINICLNIISNKFTIVHFSTNRSMDIFLFVLLL